MICAGCSSGNPPQAANDPAAAAPGPQTEIQQLTASQAPRILYTDVTVGPVSGGENNKGAYLSIFGKNFGTTGLGSTLKVYLNNVEVDNYRSLGPSIGRPDIQQISVQVGVLGNPAPGAELPVTVVVDGVASNNDKTFTANPGRILFVDNTGGNDATAVIGDIAHPFRHMQTSDTTQGAYGQLRPGDTVVLRGKGADYTDIGFGNCFLNFRYKSGSQAAGAAGTGRISVISYPGETVKIVNSGMAAVCGADRVSYPNDSQWITIAGLHLVGDGPAGVIFLGVRNNYWRVINNELTAPGSTTGGSSGIAGNGSNVKVFGNNIHAIAGSQQTNHGIYVNGDGDVAGGTFEAAYNQIYAIASGNGIQTFNNGAGGSISTNNIRIHHNVIHDVGKHGLNIADASTSGFQIWNNVVYNTRLAGLRFNSNTLHGAKVYNNTFHNTNGAANSSTGVLTNDWTFPSDALDMKNNIFIPSAGTAYASGTVGFSGSIGSISNNLYYNGTGSTGFDANAIVNDPLFVAAGADFHLQPASRAINTGSAVVSGIVTDDYDIVTPRPLGSGIDIGAYEYAAAPARASYALAVAFSGTGSVSSVPGGIDCGAACNASYISGTPVTLTATPDPNYTFMGWSGACTGAGSCLVAMNSAQNVSASFIANAVSYNLSINPAGGGVVTSSPGGINCGSTCSASYVSGTSVTLIATPATGYAFTGWGGACSGTGSCAVAMNSAQNVAASFVANAVSYNLLVSTTGSGSITSIPTGINCGSACNASYASGTPVTLTAAPATGYSFTGWNGACSGTSTCVVTMNAASSVGASFVANVVFYNLSVSTTGSGSITSTPGGINCGSTCSAGYVSGTAVTLTAVPAASSSFGGWSGACAGSAAACSVSMTAAQSVTAWFVPASPAAAPNVLYTDLVAGPVSGGENNKGVYLSIFGKNFGTTGLGSSVKVYLGGVEVDNYRSLGAAKGRADIQQITVQVGALGNPAPGTALPVKVVVNGMSSNTDHSFTVQPGDILFIDNVGGNDATAVKNDIAKPWRYVQTPSEGGAMSQLAPGDVVVLRGKAVWSDLGFENRWFRFRRTTGSQPTGAKGSGYIAIMAYPGDNVRYVAPPSTNGGIHGIGDSYPQYSDWVVVSGLHIESAASTLSDGAPINLQANSDHWRVVNNDVGPWPASSSAGDKSGGIVGNGKSNVILGNRVHDIGGGTLNHGMYFDTGTTDLEVAYNEVANIGQGNIIQTFDNLGTAELNNLNIHHNLLHDGGRYGLNISGGTNSLKAWNNVIYNTALAGVRFSVQTGSSANFAILYNTLYNTNTVSSAANAPIVNDWNLYAGTALIQNNIVMTGPGTAASGYYYIDSGNASVLQIKRNLWYGRALGTTPAQDTDPAGGKTDLLNPLFTNAAGGDLSLLSSSPAIGKAMLTTPFTIADDYRQTARPSAAAPDIGAYQR
ncbi:MAG: InlB B-repeat-containing protein [Gammaproteobacteria bacterium]|nr:InlB B-repeat-containing protein [Gammaproteobacteria bacterium]